MSNAGINIAASGLLAQQTAMDVIAENLANATTPGYVRARANLTTMPGSSAVGNGAMVANITLVQNSILAADARAGASGSSQLTAYGTLLNEAQSAFGEPSSTGIAAQLSQMWSSFDNIANNPSSLAPRSETLSYASQVATSLNEAAIQLASLGHQTVLQLQDQAGQVNSLLAQAASLNSSILSAKTGGGDANSLSNQLNQVINQLGKLINVSVRQQPNGSTNLYMGGITLVEGSTVAATLGISATGAGAGLSASVTSSSTTGPVAVTSGSIAGLLAGMSKISGFQGQLNTVASSLAGLVNTSQANGAYWYPAIAGSSALASTVTIPSGGQTLAVTSAGVASTYTIPAGTYTPAQLASAVQSSSSGALTASVNSSGALVIAASDAQAASSLTVTGGTALGVLGLSASSSATPTPDALGAPPAFFVNSSSGSSTGIDAANISVNPALTSNPLALSAGSSVSSGPLDGSNAQAMAALYNSSAGPDSTYRTLIGQIGTLTQSANQQVQNQSALSSAAQAALQSNSGVSVNQETIDMLKYQEAYQAAAKMLSAMDSLVQSLIQAA